MTAGVGESGDPEPDPGRPAFAAALRLLARRDYFSAELAARLQRKELPPDEVATAVARCVELGLVDDAAIAERFVRDRTRSRAWGPARLRAELLRRGAGREVAEAAVRSTMTGTDGTLRVALDRLERRAPAGWWRLPARRARMVSSLVGRGFAAEDAYCAVAERAKERGDDPDACDDQPGDPIDLP